MDTILKQLDITIVEERPGLYHLLVLLSWAIYFLQVSFSLSLVGIMR